MTLLQEHPTLSTTALLPLRAGAPLVAEVFAQIRRRMVLRSCKWDPQVGDESTLADFPLLIRRDQWHALARWSESLAAELMAVELELLDRPELHRTLALPRRLRPLLGNAAGRGATPCPVRTLRFDFHWTTEGWRISEVNSDVPGGYTEASAFTQLIARHCPELGNPAGDPARTWADCIARSVEPGGHVAMLAAPGFMEDQQVVAYLACRLERRGIVAHLVNPTQIDWTDKRAHLRTAWYSGRLSALFRFYQAEWLAALPRRTRLNPYFAGALTPVANPGSSILTESKRLPLVWDRLGAAVPTWRHLLPETRDPRDAGWRSDDGWLIKSAYCNTGDTVASPSLVSARRWESARRWARYFPGEWIAQRRFTPLSVSTPRGDMFPCLGVYTINGAAAGIYGRLSRWPVVDYRALDVACLVERGADEEHMA